MYKNIFDSHAHYDSSKFKEDRDTLLSELPQKGIRGVMTAASDLGSARAAQQLANRYDYIYFAAGIHPHDAKNAPANMEKRIELFSKDAKMKAVGEIGLDYHYDFSPRDRQREVFIRQLNLARKLDLPVIIHDREAHGDMLDILKEYRPKGVVHSYSGSAEMAKELLKLGLFFGFTGVVTFKNAVKPLEAIEVIPIDKILVETDCPYLAPVPYRGKRSDSSMIPHTAQRIAEVKGLTVQEVLDISFENTCRLFDINNL